MEIGKRPFIVAELSANHEGDIQKALMLISAAWQCGCDAVKIQTYELADLPDPDPANIVTPRDWYPRLFAVAKEIGIPLFSSVFALWAVDFLKQFDCPAYKLASPESTRLPENEYMRLGRAIRDTGKTFMASSGRKDMDAISALCPDVLFYCVAGYPANVTDDDLRYLTTLSKQRKHRGFSDHSNDIKTPLAMIAAGATVIEKHFKLDDNCIDAAFSLNPKQMRLLCEIAHR
jgi:sialic acid synthase SpsE